MLSAMSNPSRLEILQIVTQGEICVTDLQSKIGIGRTALSRHLGRLRKKNLVKTRKEIHTVFYWCDAPQVLAILTVLHEIFPVQRFHIEEVRLTTED